MKNKGLLSLILAFLTSFTQFAFAQTVNLDQRVRSETLRSTGIYEISHELDGKEVLKKSYDVPKGTKFTFRPSVVLTRPHLESSEGNISTSAGRYLGSLIIDNSTFTGSERARINELNQRRIFIYEWHVDKDNYLRTVFDLAPLEKRAELGDRFEWDRISTKGLWTTEAANAIQTIGYDLLDNPPSDVEEFCPNFHNLDLVGRTAFWVHLMNSIAKRESAFDPMVGNDESSFGANNQGVVSRGLLQISLGSARASSYRNAGCTATTTDDLHTVAGNFECGVAIFTHWSNTDDCISCRTEEGAWRGIARYWSTLRERYRVSCSVCSSGVANIGYKEQIIEETSKTRVCRLN